MKKVFSIILALLLLTSISVVAFANGTDGSYRDTATHWAKAEIEVWSGYGVLKGNDDGTFAPDRSMTRGEFAVVLDRVMKYQTASTKTFADLDDNFYTQSILRLHEAGVMNGYDGNIMPNDIITREEAAVMLCRALGIQPQKTANQTFGDSGKISSWAKEYLNALVNRKLMNGDGTNLNPGSMITRAEVVKIMDNTAVPVLKSGTVENLSTDKILIISAPDVTLKGCEIAGDVLITQGVTNGAVAIVESNLKGYVSIDNDRKNFITFTDSEVADTAFQASPAVGDGTGAGSGTETNPPEEDNKDEEKPSTPPSGDSGNNGGGVVTPGPITPGPVTPGPVAPANYTVTFVYNGETIKTETVVANGTLGDKLPTNPVADKEGYTFEGWFDGNTKITATTKITKNMTATAKVKALFTVSFYYNGEIYQGYKQSGTIKIKEGNAIGTKMPGNPLMGKDGEGMSGTNPDAFGGWFDQNGNPVDENTIPAQDLVVTAQIDVPLANEQMAINLPKAWEDMNNNLEHFPAGNQADFIQTVMNCIDKVIPYMGEKVIDSDFIRRTFPDDVQTAKDLKDAIEAAGERDAFIDNLTWLKVNTLEWLLEAFEIDVNNM